MPGPNQVTTDSILGTTKKLLGLDMTLTDFDVDLIVCINTAFNVLTQLGVGPTKGFMITGVSENWSDFIGDDIRLNMVKQYIFLKTRITFNPPQIGAVLTALENSIKELEFRLNVQVDPEDTFSSDSDYEWSHFAEEDDEYGFDDDLDDYPNF